MAHTARIIDGFEVVPLCDAIGPMGESLRRPILETFIGAAREDFDGDEWVLHFHCYLLRRDARPTILVDAGIGAANSPAASWAPVPGGLVDELAECGIAPADVDAVVLTHLHSDHVSGAVDASGAPAFPNAWYIVQQAEVDWIGANRPNPIQDRILTPLQAQLHVVNGTANVNGGITVHHTPGHTPGHQVVSIGELAITGDLVLHPVQIRDPSIMYIYDEDPKRAIESRRKLLDRVRTEGGLIATAHSAEPFTALAASA